MKPKHDVHNTVRQHRMTQGMTQQELADRVGVTRQTVLSIEKGKYTPSIGLALLMSRVFEVNVEALFQLNGGDEND